MSTIRTLPGRRRRRLRRRAGPDRHARLGPPTGEPATVSVLHAVPDTPVDVYSNDQLVFDDFQPGTLTDPLPPVGAYRLQVFPADAADNSGDPILRTGPDVPAGANVTVVAHLDEGGNPALTPFVNDVSAIPAGQARVTVRHTAAAPAVDVRAGGTPVVEGLTNPNEADARRAGRNGPR